MRVLLAISIIAASVYASAGPTVSGGAVSGQVAVCQILRGKYYSAFSVSKTSESAQGKFTARYRDINNVGAGKFMSFECKKSNDSKTRYTCLEMRAGEGRLRAVVYGSSESPSVSISRQDLDNRWNEIDRISCSPLTEQ
jgi:hypothetical protein